MIYQFKMATFLRSSIITRRLKKPLYHNRSNYSNGYVVLIPEIGEDIERNALLTENGLPEFNDITIEKCIASISKQCFDFENGIQQIEQSSPNCKNAFINILKPIEKLDSPLQLTWGIAKTLYLGNNSLIPTKSYLQIHERAHKARLVKFNSVSIFNAISEEINRLKTLTDEEQRLLHKYFLEGKLNGLNVSLQKRERLHHILREMQTERQHIENKVKIATKSFSGTMNEMISEFPESLAKAMSVNNEASRGPWKMSLECHIYEPFMQYCPVRISRWNMWHAYVQRCSNNTNKELETSTNIEKLRNLRKEQASILGFDTFADMSMETKMAGSIENVLNFLETVRENAKPMQDIELKRLQKFAEDRGFDDKLEHWDIPYWQRKQAWSLNKINHDEIRDFFPLPKVINSLFNLCNTLFNIQIVERSNTQRWHKDVKYYDVYEDSSSKPIAGFYLDLYAREDEKILVYDDAGWHVSIRNKSTISGTLPLSALIFNFQPPKGGNESLLSFKEVTVLFQRFGHSLRHLLSKVNYSEVSGLSNVEWDTAEVCGKVMAHCLYDPDTIRAISGHYKTKEPLPEEIVNNLRSFRRHMSGYNICRELYLSRLDMELHTKTTFWWDIVKQIWSEYNTIPLDKRDSHVLSFTQIFSQDWGAAYYSKLWSEMIAADVYSAFKEAKKEDQGVLAIGKRYKDTFLAMGGSCHPSKVFRLFRGRDPSTQPLLDDLGLSKKDLDNSDI